MKVRGLVRKPIPQDRCMVASTAGRRATERAGSTRDAAAVTQPGRLDRGVVGGRDETTGVGDHPDPGIGGRQPLRDLTGGVLGRADGEHHLDAARVVLGQDVPYRLFQVVRFVRTGMMTDTGVRVLRAVRLGTPTNRCT
jgi:hypothetical protein